MLAAILKLLVNANYYQRPLPVPIHNSRNHNLIKFSPKHIAMQKLYIQCILKPGSRKGFLWLPFSYTGTGNPTLISKKSISFFTILTEVKINFETRIFFFSLKYMYYESKFKKAISYEFILNTCINLTFICIRILKQGRTILI